MSNRIGRIQIVSALLAVSMTATACSTMNNRDRGAVIGAGTGAVIGGVIGNQTGSTARGAIIGAVLGGAAGAVIGHQMDQQAREIDAAIPGADVTRIGEGIAVTFESGILFPYDSDVLLPAARGNLDQLANSLNKYPGSSLTIVGHADSVGSDSYNQALSERRARAASAYLQSKGVASSRLTALGRGETEPLFSNASEDGRRRNRRVEVAIYASEEYRQRILRENP
ncbi:MAG TPA: OmpA family protein [Gemmatimonadaceae bacterium]|nr:OmpA family protein [Gemmatimonadaceae bacterium]